MDVPKYETAVDKAIREAQERGAFDNLPGHGKPLRGLDQPHDDNWWLNDWMKREGVSMEALLPMSIQLRKEIDRLPATLQGLRSEAAVRDAVNELNGRIVEFMRAPEGPAIPIRRVDLDDALERWRAERPAVAQKATPARPDVAEKPTRPRWWPWRKP
ncbi:J-domain-containing protein [Pseudonocardia sp. TRM90224]|uniref:DnaJ family domain-containing protein n=1 Tax=Pseudonocardia sp. TRM90224 TaxID=2812678 RepID=UPI001E5EFEAB|nr:DUF1992 domain-containing protein [Pseudonocardia sp. TRM90224]